jgi:hypothetical protein
LNLKAAIKGTSREWLFVYLIFFAHLSLYWLPQINLEWAFSDAIIFFQTGQQSLIERYFSNQANTLGISYSSFILAKFLPALKVEFLPRIFSAMGVILLGSALIRLSTILQMKGSVFLLIILVLTNPLIWVYSGRGTADFLPAAMALFSVSLLWDKSVGPIGIAAAILTFSMAIILKYHAIILLPIIWVEALTRPKVEFRFVFLRLSIVSALILLGPCLYIYYIYLKFGFWIIPSNFETVHQISLSSFLTNLVGYFSYLSGLLFPLTVFSLLGRILSVRSLAQMTAVLTLLFLFGYYLLVLLAGEMKFGPLDQHLNEKMMYGILCMCIAPLCFTIRDCYLAYKDNRERIRLLICIVFGIVFFIAVLSMSRPSQRYLLFILPMAYYFIMIYIDKSKLITASVIGLFVLLNAFVGISQYATGIAANELVQEIRSRNLMNVTNPGAILGHAGNLFPHGSSSTMEYEVVNGQSPEQLFFAESSPTPFVRKVFSVVPIIKE